jgi:TonB family protein
MRSIAVLLLLAAACPAQTIQDWLNRGTEYLRRYVPGAESPDNRETADQAEAAFRRVLEIDPNNRVALSSLGSLSLNRKNWDEARTAYQRLVNLDPNNAEAYYSLAFIDWAQWYPAYGAARTKLGMPPAQPGPIPDPAVRTALRGQWWPTLEDGIWNLNRALEINPKYDDAMAYMNLFLRERADLQDTEQEYRQDTAEADRWVQKALDTKKEKAGQMLPAGSVTPKRIRMRMAPEPVTRVEPIYPPLARQARIQGTVRFSAVLDKQGRVTNLQVVSGHPLLVPAAMEAVKQWVYRPMLLNGQPVEVVTQIEVNFTLPQ